MKNDQKGLRWVVTTGSDGLINNLDLDFQNEASRMVPTRNLRVTEIKAFCVSWCKTMELPTSMSRTDVVAASLGYKLLDSGEEQAKTEGLHRREIETELDSLVTQDLFSAEGKLHNVPLPGADISYLSAMSLGSPPGILLRTLIDTVPWRAEDIVVWGKKYAQPRLIAWYGDRGQTYTYSGIRLDPLPWTDLLISIRQDVQNAAGVAFNSVLLNYYRNQNDGMGFHGDNEPELGPQPTIASLSLGEQRTFVLKHKTRKDLKPVKLPLESGSLLLMKGDTQKNWKHGIDKETHPCGPRVNLTFRRIFPHLANDSRRERRA